MEVREWDDGSAASQLVVAAGGRREAKEGIASGGWVSPPSSSSSSAASPLHTLTSFLLLSRRHPRICTRGKGQNAAAQLYCLHYGERVTAGEEGSLFSCEGEQRS